MSDRSSSQLLTLLIGGACVVIVIWGVTQASHLLVILLIALLLTYCILPFPRWLMRRFHISKTMAIVTTVTLVIIGHFVVSLLLVETGLRIKERLPIYEEHLKIIFEHTQVFLSAHGVNLAASSASGKPATERIIGFAREVAPGVIGLLSDRFLVALFSLLFLVEMTEHDETRLGPLARGLLYYGGDVQGFIVVMAKTGAITALANFILLLAIGVDFPFLWCVLYFFLHFIPDLGILISLVPPTLLALVTLGWKQALLVAGGLILTNALADYVLKPRFMKKQLHISFLGVMLSLMFWGYLLGPWGSIMATPLTMALRRFVSLHARPEELAAASST